MGGRHGGRVFGRRRLLQWLVLPREWRQLLQGQVHGGHDRWLLRRQRLLQRLVLPCKWWPLLQSGMSAGKNMALACTRFVFLLQTRRSGQMQGPSLQFANLFQIARRPATYRHESPQIADLLQQQSASVFLVFLFPMPAAARGGVSGTDRAPLNRGEATYHLVGSVDVPSVCTCSARTARSVGTMLRPAS